MKRLSGFLVFLLIITGILAGCGSAASSGGTSSPAKPTESAGSSAVSPGQDASSVNPPAEPTPADASSKESTPAVTADEPGELVILYTNDVQCGIDENIGYAGLAAYRKELEAAGKTVLLVDCGDSFQGDTIGTLTQGEALVDIMNEVRYDFATLGNHEFDYSVPRMLELTEKANFPYVCCNFMDLRTDKHVYEPYIIKEAAGRKIAFIGAVTPRTLTYASPAYFQNDKGEQIYGFCWSDDGKALYTAVQEAVDSARAEGADLCILLAHLGVDPASSPFMAPEVVANTTGIDIVLDGHTRVVIESEQMKNRDGKNVLYSQTGTKLANIGELTIAADGTASTRLISSYEKKDPETGAFIAKLQEEADKILGEKLGETAYDLVAIDEKGSRIVRYAETNLGDLSADSIRYVTGAEIGFDHGGNVRVNIPAGEITKKDIYDVHPFVKGLVTIKVSGQVIADALEYGASKEPEEWGGFIQVSGVSYTVDVRIPSGAVRDENGMLKEIVGERRVRDILVNGEPLDPERVYTVGGPRTMLVENGDGHTEFANAAEVTPVSFTDAEALEKYICEELGGSIPDTYANPGGNGRITLVGKEE